MGLFIAFAIAYHLASEYEMPKLNSAIVSTAVFLIVSAPTTSAVASNLIVDGKSATDLLSLAGNYIPTTYLDAKGIFTAILVAIGCVEIMHFMFKKDIRIKMPEGVPPAISSSFDAILSSIFSISDNEFLIWAAWLLMLRLTVWRFCCKDLNFLFFKAYGLLLCANTFPTSRIFYYMKIS